MLLSEEQRCDRLLDVLTDEENGIRLIVSRLGAELVSVARRNPSRDWIGFLHRDNDLRVPCRRSPAANARESATRLDTSARVGHSPTSTTEKGWANHATVMGYFLHRIKDERSLYRGHEIRGGTHSFLRSKVWHRVESPRDGELTYRITPEDFSATEYPLKVSLDLTYRIEGERITVLFRFQNGEPELTAHVGFGLHPGFGATSFDSFRFEMPAGLYRRHFSPTNYLSGETEDISFAGGEMPFERQKLPGSYILELVDVPDRTFTFSDPPSGRVVSMHLSGVPYLTLWSDGGPYLCVEPCWGLTDHYQQRAFEDKEGIQKIPAGQELNASFSFAPRLLL
jgi:galactose mutarotase-like enzyme